MAGAPFSSASEAAKMISAASDRVPSPRSTATFTKDSGLMRENVMILQAPGWSKISVSAIEVEGVASSASPR